LSERTNWEDNSKKHLQVSGDAAISKDYKSLWQHGKLYGRENELLALTSTLRDVQQPQQQVDDKDEKVGGGDGVVGGGAKVVFVEGLSGSGKSALVRSAFQDNKDCIFGSGKFDQRQTGMPYAALMSCFSEICGRIVDNGDQEKYKAILEKKLAAEELEILCFLIPKMYEIVNKATIPDRCAGPHRTCCSVLEKGGKECLEKMRYALRVFLCSICCKEQAMVLFLDDLQWMDIATFDILKSLVSNSELRHCVFVGSFRGDEVSESHIVSKWINTIMKDEPPMRIRVGNLSVHSLAALLADVLKVEQDYEHIKELVDIIHRKTEGNIFHVLQLLEFLQAEGLLAYSLSSYRWTWDTSEIRGRTSLSDNVVKIVLAKINRLSNGERLVLRLCSCLGYRFDRHVLGLIVMTTTVVTPCLAGVDIDDCLESLIEEGLLERLSVDRLKFAHDKVLQAASQLVTCKDDHAQLHYEVGKIIIETYGLDDVSKLDAVEDRLLFLCVDQLDLGQSLLDEEGRRKLAYLNLEAANRAASFSAFSPSADYLESGSSLLDTEKRWTEHYKLSLEMFTSLAEMTYCAGRTMEHKAAANEVLTHSKSIDDSIRAYMAKIRCLMGENNDSETIATVLQVMNELGEPLPPKPSKSFAKAQLCQLRQRLDSTADEDILSLPTMTSKCKSNAIRIICDTIFPVENFNRELSKTALCSMVNLILDNGLSPDSASVFAIVGYHYASEYDIDMATRCTKLSMELLKRPEFRAGKCVSSGYNLKARHWREPLSHLVDEAIENHRAGLRTGELFSSFSVSIEWAKRMYISVNAISSHFFLFFLLVRQSATLYSILFFYSGLPLEPLAADLKSFCDLMFDYGQHFYGLLLIPTFQCVLNLTGKSDNILDMSHGAAERYRKRFGGKSSRGQESEFSFLMQIAFYCEDFRLATHMAEKLKHAGNGISRGSFFEQTRVFFFTLIAIQQARKNTRRPLKQEIFRREAKKLYEAFRLWVIDKKSINAVHKLLILDAEMMSIQRRPQVDSDTIRAAYDKAVAASTRSGFLQDGALAAQLASRAIPAAKDLYFERALELYSSWGAAGLVEHLLKKPSAGASESSSSHSDSAAEGTSTQQQQPGTSFRSRERFDARLVKAHKSLDVSDDTAKLSLSSNSSYRSMSRPSLYYGYG
jgi:predicted ATPase